MQRRMAVYCRCFGSTYRSRLRRSNNSSLITCAQMFRCSQVGVLSIGNSKGKVHPTSSQEDPDGDRRYTSTLSVTSALDKCGWSAPRSGLLTPGISAGGQRHGPASLPPAITGYLLHRRLRGLCGLSGRVRKISTHRDSIPGPSNP